MSGLTELPSTAPSSLGPDKVDRIVYMNEAYRTQAFLINKMRTYLIQMGEMLGLGDASTPGSLAYRVDALETAIASPATLKIPGAGPSVVTPSSETVIGGFGAFAPAAYSNPTVEWEVTAIFAPATSGSAEIRLYDMGTRAAPAAGTLRSTITITVFDGGVLKCVTQALTVSATPGVNVSTIFDSERIYELRAILVGATPGDELSITNVSLLVTGTLLGGTFAPTTAPYMAVAPTAALTSERVFTPQKSIVGTDGGAGAAYAVELSGDVATPGANKSYGTDSGGTKGWYANPEGKKTFRIVVGNATNGDTLADCDYLDPGDGSGIEAALAAAALEAMPPEVFLRDGFYGPGLAPPFVVPGSVRVFGSSYAAVQIEGSATVRQVFSLASGAILDTLRVQAPAGTPGAMSGTEVISGVDAVVRDVMVYGLLIDATEPTETLTALVRVTGAYVGEISGCVVLGSSRATNGVSALTGIEATSTTEITNNRVVGLDRGIVVSAGLLTLVRGNLCGAAVVSGITIDGCSNCTVTGNTLEVAPAGLWTGPSPGVSVTGSSSGNTVTGNTVSGWTAGTVAISLGTSTSRNVVNGNAIGQRIVSDLGTDNNVEVNQLPWRLNVATAAQFTSGGTAPDATPPLIPASRARVVGATAIVGMNAADAFDVTLDLAGPTYPVTITFLGTENTPRLICDRINSEWQTAAGIPSGPTAYIAHVDGSSRGRIFIESPTRSAGSSVSIVDNVAGTMDRMGFVSPGPTADAGTAPSQPTYFGTFPRRDCAVNFSTFNGLLGVTDAFTYENESVAPVVVTLAGAPYLDIAALVADINGQVGSTVAIVDPRAPNERFFMSSALCGSTASQTLTDGLGTPLATMGFTTGALSGVDDTPTLTPGNIPGAWGDPGSAPDSLVFEVNGCAGGIAVFLVNASLPATVKKHLTFEAIPEVLSPTAGPVESTAFGNMGLVFNYDPVRGVGLVMTGAPEGLAYLNLTGNAVPVSVQLPEPGYMFRLEADTRTHLSSIAAGSPYEGCPVTVTDFKFTGILTGSTPPTISDDPQVRGLRTYGGPQMPFDSEYADWYVDPDDVPTSDQFGVYFFITGPSYGPIRWYITAASVEIKQ